MLILLGIQKLRNSQFYYKYYMASSQQRAFFLNQMTHHSSGSNALITDNKGMKRKSDLMKFIDQGKLNRLQGKRCFSHNTNVSKDFPECFQRQNSTQQSGYHRVSNPEQKIKNNTCQSFYTQKNYFHVTEQTQQSNRGEFIQDYTKTIQLNSNPFNKKISDYSEFIDKNVSSLWGHNYPLMGFQRSKEGRKAQYLYREKSINEKQKTREAFLKSFHTNKGSQQSTSRSKNSRLNKQSIRTNNDLLFGLRTKVRSDRNQIANQLYMKTQSYLIQDLNSIDYLHHYNSSDIGKRSHSHQRPFTSLRKHQSILSSRTEMFDELLQTQGRIKQSSRHAKTKSSAQIVNIISQTNEQMNRKLEQWSNTNDNKFSPTAKVVKKMGKKAEGTDQRCQNRVKA